MKQIIFAVILSVLLINTQAQNVFTVTKTSDPDPFLYSENPDNPDIQGTLQWAVRKANDSESGCIINFAIQGTAPHIIALDYELPIIRQSLIIDGTSQADYQIAMPAIIIDGQNKHYTAIQFYLTDNSIVKGLDIRNFKTYGISFNKCNNIIIEQNVISDIYNYEITTQASSAITLFYCSNGSIFGNHIGNLTETTNIKDNGISFMFASNNFTIGGVGENQSNIITNTGIAGIRLYAQEIYGITISANKIYNNPTAISLLNGANEAKQAPTISSYDEAGVVTGTSEPNDIIEIFGSSGEETANEYLTSITADETGNWTTTLENTTWNGIVATATDESGNTSKLSIAFVKIQTIGSNKENALLIVPTQDFSYVDYNMEPNQSEFWFKFIAENNNYIISAKPQSQITCANIEEIFLYSNDDMINIGFSSLNDSLYLLTNELINGETYFIKVKRQITNYSNFSMVVQLENNIRGFSNDYACEPTCANYVSNGNFDEVYDSDGVVDDTFSFSSLEEQTTDVCGWHTAWGSPQLTPANTISSENHWAKMWLKNLDGTITGEGLYTWLYLPLLPSNNYQLNIRYYNSGAICSNWEIRLTSMNFSPSFEAGESLPNFTNDNSQLISNQSDSREWTTVSIPITPNNEWSQLCIYPAYVESSSETYQTWLYIDDISIVATTKYLDNQTICSEQGATLSASDGISYLWSNQGETTQNIYVEPSETTTYTVTVTDGYHCEHNEEVTVYTGPNITTDPIINICNGTSAQIANNLVVSGGTGNYSYAWHPSVDLDDSDILNPTTSTTVTTTYSVDVIDNENGCTATAEVTVNVGQQFNVTIDGDVASCNGNGATISANTILPVEQAEFHWSTGATTQEITVYPMVATTYSVTVTDNIYGCVSTASIIVKRSNLVVSSVDYDVCRGEGITISPIVNSSSAVTYSWLGGQTTSSINATPTITGWYTVTVTNADGCIEVEQIDVNVHYFVGLQISPETPTICSGSTLLLTAMQGESFYWEETGETTQTITVNPSETTSYNLIAYNEYGCRANESVKVTVVKPITIHHFDIHNEDCDIAGSITVHPELGLPPYSYIWSNGATTQTISNIPAGTYTVTINDEAGCETVSSAKVIYDCCESCRGFVFYDGATQEDLFNAFGTYDIENEEFCINGTMTLSHGDISLTNCVINMGTNAQIIITKTGLTLNKTTVQACGTNLWNRIYVSGADSRLFIKNGSLLKDAKTAVYFDGYTEHNVCEIESSTFSKNKVAVYAKRLKEDYEVFEVSASNFMGGTLVDGTLAQTGIYLDNTYQCDFNIGNNNKFKSLENGILARNILGLNVAQYNDFTSCKYGIYYTNATSISYISNTKLTVNNCTFMKNDYGIKTFNVRKDVSIQNSNFRIISRAGIDVYEAKKFLISENNFFKVSGNGILVQNVNIINDIQSVISNNYINNARQGIKCAFLNEFSIVQNEITIASTSSHTSENSGINIQSCNMLDVRENTISLLPSSQSQLWTTGIRTDNSDRNQYQCNMISKLGYGLWFGGHTYNTAFVSNTMKQCNIGLHFNVNEGFGDQGTKNYPNDNKWISNTLDSYAWYTLADIYEFNVRNDSPYKPTNLACYPDNNENEASVITVLNATPLASPLSCPDDNGFSEDPNRVPYGQERKIAANEISFSVNVDENKWFAKKYLHSRIKHEPVMLSLDSVFVTAYDSLEQTTTAKLHEYFKVASDTLVDSNYVQRLVQLNNALVINNEIENNHKIVSEIYLDVFTGDSISLDSVQYETLYNIAMLCPYIYGEAVYRARVILSFFYPEQDYMSDCEMNEDKSEKSLMFNEPETLNSKQIGDNLSLNNNNSALNIYPNPANKQLYIEGLEYSDYRSIQIYNLTGQNVRELNVGESVKTIIVDISDLPKGVYVIRINNKSFKFSIMH
ncbi:MAG: hypothetical protein A2W98_05405 [Bacteroidetes bacterium GWF2_33_38]|nr:MAG: hypothetical protein A2W98_05405 [Bacteroidetes bacterium GWF2_33_38]OFY74755.1 MAG: hypothetical protein A2265_09270 [Bacteroidetes bacterium RIFOXYA12_FULL_33_9]